MIELVQRIRAARQERGVPATSGDPWQVVVTAGGDDRAAASRVRRLLEVLAPVRVVDMHGNGRQPIVLEAGSLHAEIQVEGGE